MKFTYLNTVHDTEKFNRADEFNHWLKLFEVELSDITSQLDQNTYLKQSGSPSKSHGWIKGKEEQKKYIKSVKGLLEKERNDLIHSGPPNKSKVARMFQYIAQDRLSVDVYSMILSEVMYMLENNEKE